MHMQHEGFSEFLAFAELGPAPSSLASPAMVPWILGSEEWGTQVQSCVDWRPWGAVAFRGRMGRPDDGKDATNGGSRCMRMDK